MVGYWGNNSRPRERTVIKNIADEAGGVSVQGVFALIAIILVIVFAISMVQLIQVPMDLENSVKKDCKEWLGLRPYDKNGAIPGFTRRIKETVATVLKDHTYNPKDLKIVFVNQKNITINLPYTVNIEIFGFKLTFDKVLDLDETAYTF